MRLDGAGKVDLLQLTVGEIDLPKSRCERKAPDKIVFPQFQGVSSARRAFNTIQSPAATPSALEPMPYRFSFA